MVGHQESWHRGVFTCSVPPVVLQLWLSFMSSWGSCSVCYPMALTGWRYLHPLPNACNPVDIHFNSTLPEVFTHPLWMSSGEVITSCWSTPGKSCWPDVGWSPDHYPLMVYSCYHYPWELASLGWGWYISPVLGGHPHTRECQSLMWWEEVGCGGGCMTAHIGLLLCRKVHLSQSDEPPQMSHLPPIFNLPLFLKGISLH